MVNVPALILTGMIVYLFANDSGTKRTASNSTENIGDSKYSTPNLFANGFSISFSVANPSSAKTAPKRFLVARC
jgi:hypothetical protein